MWFAWVKHHVYRYEIERVPHVRISSCVVLSVGLVNSLVTSPGIHVCVLVVICYAYDYGSSTERVKHILK